MSVSPVCRTRDMEVRVISDSGTGNRLAALLA